MKTDFIGSVQTMANAKREESVWLKANLENLLALEGLLLMREVGHKPNIFGDIVIFWEVPAGWTILTRDASFVILRDKHRPDILVYRIRAPRITGSTSCAIQLVSMSGSKVTGTLSNHSSSGACITCSSLIGDTGDEVLLSSPEIGGSRNGKLVWANSDAAGAHQGIKFITKRALHPTRRHNPTGPERPISTPGSSS